MAAFGAGADAVAADESLSEAAREARIMEIYAEYEPDVAAFSALAAQYAAEIAALAVAEADIEAEVAEAMADVDIQAEVAAALAEARAAQAEAVFANAESRVVLADEMEGMTAVEQAALQAQIAAAVTQAVAGVDYSAIIEASLAQVDVESVMAEAMTALEHLDIQMDDIDADADREPDTNE